MDIMSISSGAYKYYGLAAAPAQYVAMPVHPSIRVK